jgi:hypothetical protein
MPPLIPDPPPRQIVGTKVSWHKRGYLAQVFKKCNYTESLSGSHLLGLKLTCWVCVLSADFMSFPTLFRWVIACLTEVALCKTKFWITSPKRQSGSESQNYKEIDSASVNISIIEMTGSESHLWILCAARRIQVCPDVVPLSHCLPRGSHSLQE